MNQYGMLLRSRFGFFLVVACVTSPGSQVHAQSSVTIYGTLDTAIDQVRKGEGNVQGTVFGLAGGVPVANSVAAPKSTVTRVSPSLSAETFVGFKGSEDIGEGYRAGFTLEAGLTPDNGGLANDGRFFGKQAFVNLTTPIGEVRLGRQVAPMLIGYYVSTLGRLGTTDLMAAALTHNNLQISQDNAISYLAQSGPWLGVLTYSPNGGVASRISAARSTAIGDIPAASDSNGQIVGGQSAAAESADGRGKSAGALVSYLIGDSAFVASYHRNNFGNAPVGLATAGGFIPLFVAQSYRSYMLGAKYSIAGTGTTVGANFHAGRFDLAGETDPNVRTFTLGVKQMIGALELSGSYVNARFTNFTKGKDTGLMLGADYHFSKRTALYSRVGYVKDSRGDVVLGDQAPLPIAGGPGALLLPLGAQEVPLFSGAGQSMDARTGLVSFGIRHSF